MNREEWLNELVAELRPMFAAINAPLPEKIRVTCGFPSQKARTLNKAIGEHWAPDASADGFNEILISPVIAEPMEAAAILVHELAHAATPGCGHKGEFVRVIRALWLEGKATATVAGQEFRENFGPIVEAIGPYPHGALNVGLVRKVQSTRLIKAWCPACGYTIRLTEKWASLGLPECPNDGTTFTR
jgi:ribosomal protein L37E